MRGVNQFQCKNEAKLKKSFMEFSSISSGIKLILCLVPLLSIVGAQGESKWSWSSNNRNSIADSSDRLIDRRKYESLEDLR